jgi:hypothetical protein
MTKTRTPLNFDDDDILSMASQPLIKPKVTPEQIKEVANQSGFFSRQPQLQDIVHDVSTRRRRKISPYNSQLGVKVRPEIKEIFQNISDTLGIHDCSTFELAILALLEKGNYSQLLEKYKQVTNF